MNKDKPTYTQLEQRLKEAEATLESIYKGEVDFIMGAVEPLKIQLKSVTEEKERLIEENQTIAHQWETTFNAIDSVIWLLDKDQNIVRANKTSDSYFTKSFNASCGDKCFCLVHGLNHPIENCPFIRARETMRRESMEIEINNTWHEVVVDPIIDKNNDLVGAVHILNNISERKKAERELTLAKEKAEENERLKSAFLANMSHEIRTPMNGILGFLELLKEPNLSDTSREKYIEIVNKSGKRLLNTINDIIEISKIDSKQISVQKSRFSISKLLGDLVTFFQPEAYKKGLFLESYIPEENIEIESDKAKLESVFTNLIKNAIKFTTEGTITVKLELTKKQLVIRVKDTGSGISSTKQKNIFERFVQGETALTRPYEGSGLGLSITKEYVSLLNGEISLKSELGRGSTFSVIFNKDVLNISDNAATDEIIKQDITKKKTESKVILVAEDDFISYQFLNTILNGGRFELIWAKDGNEAIEIALNRPIDLILMDAKMPNTNGFDATKRILREKPGLPIIMQTAYAMSGDREKALNCGCVDYISKPILKDLLLEKINKII